VELSKDNPVMVFVLLKSKATKFNSSLISSIQQRLQLPTNLNHQNKENIMIPRKGYVTWSLLAGHSVTKRRSCLIHKFFTLADEDGSDGAAIVEFEDGSCQTILVENVVFTEKFEKPK